MVEFHFYFCTAVIIIIDWYYNKQVLLFRVMKKVLIINSNQELSQELIANLQFDDKEVQVKVKDNTEEALKYLHYELADVTILNFADANLPMMEALNQINEDSWLNNGGLIALHDLPNEDEFLKSVQHSNLLGIISLKSIKQRLKNLVKLIIDNEQLIFQREVPVQIESGLAGTFLLETDPFEANVYASLLSLFLYNANLVDIEVKSSIKNALVEMLMNAIEHGNCNIGFEDKTKGMMEGKSIFDLINEKMEDPQYKDRKVKLSFVISQVKSSFSIEDEGGGFDWRMRQKGLDDEQNEVLAHGRGIVMTQDAAQNLSYNEKGNKVSFEFNHQRNQSNLRPKLLKDKEEIHYKAGDFVFEYGAVSNYLVYIVSGSYSVIDKNGNQFAKLVPNDIFIGEMAFLLGNVRTATVQAQYPGTVIKLTKDEFIERIQKYPYYGLFLSRLLAQRLATNNKDRFESKPILLAQFRERSATLYKDKKTKEACNLLKIALKFFPNDFELLQVLTEYLAINKKYTESIEYGQKAIRINETPKLQLILGFSYLKSQNYNLAETYLQKILVEDENNADAIYHIIRLYLAINKIELAKLSYQKLKEVAPNSKKLEKIAKIL